MNQVCFLAFSQYRKQHQTQVQSQLEQYFEKFNRYTTISAKEEFSKGTKVGIVKLFVKPVAAFVKHYIIKLGFLDGTAGFVLSVLSAKAVFVKYSKLMELIEKEKYGNKN